MRPMTRFTSLLATSLLLCGPVAFAEDVDMDATAEATGPTTYTLDPAKSVLAVLVKYDRNALVGGHDHVIQASSFDGTVTWAPDDMGACKVSVSFPVDALVVDPPGSRDRAGLEGTTGDGDKRKIKNNFMSKSQLDASNYPRVSFESTSCKADEDGAVVTGPLTLRGVGHTVSADMKISADGETFSATGSFSAVHSDWGFDPYTALFGSLRNDESLSFTIDVKGSAK
jgi:polyisoprenoid-binding protein YceI